MPTYEYLCKNCQNQWEEEHSINDPPVTYCKQCKKDTAIRLISAGTGFILAGGGWASTNYSKD